MSAQPEAQSNERESLLDPILPIDKRVVLILVGLIGSGKSTFSQALEQHFPEFRRCSQDDLGDRRSVEALARQSLAEGLSVCIDRTNFDESQRATWINIAREFGRAEPWVIVFDTPYEICAARVAERTGHPTITSPELGLQVLQRFRSQYRPPAPHEGYTRILYLRPADCPDSGYTEGDVREVMRRLRESPEVVPATARTPMRDGGYYRGSFEQRGSRGRGFQTTRRSYSRGDRGGPYTRGGYRGGTIEQTTLPWARRGGDLSGPSAGSGYAGHALDARRSGYRAEDGFRPAGVDRTPDNNLGWRR
ncbi:P-loop containing nucleoside triphosphate hydrolase protein [Trametes gibbosa]|nr:P-loop containing nucleoside triphosphate hydrolase protein [Trametes gibbosa]